MKYLQGIRKGYCYEIDKDNTLVVSERMMDIQMLERKFMDFLSDSSIIQKIKEAKESKGLKAKSYTSLSELLCDYSNVFSMSILESYSLYIADETGIMDVLKKVSKNIRGDNIPTHYENITGEYQDIIIWNDKQSKIVDVANILEEVYAEDVLVDIGYMFKDELDLTQYQFSIITIFPKEEYADKVEPEILSIMIFNNETKEDYVLFPVYIEETKDE